MAEHKPYHKLAGIPKKDIYKVPDGYFDSLQQKIDQRIEGEKRGKVIRVNWKYVSYAAAASVALLVVVLLGYQQGISPVASVEDMIAEIAVEDCAAYLKNSDIQIDEIIQSTHPDNWEGLEADPVNPMDPELDEEDMELLYERYGVTSDENLQTL